MDIQVAHHSYKMWVQQQAEKAGLSISWERGVDKPRTDGSTIWLPEPTVEWTKEDWYELMGKAWHESQHPRGDNMDDLRLMKEKKGDVRDPFWFVHNVVVDHNIEKKALENDGLDGNKACIEFLRMKGALRRIHEFHPEATEGIKAKFAALFAFDSAHREEFMDIPIAESEALLGEGIENYTALAADGELGKLYGRVRTAEENYKLTEKICSVLGIEKRSEDEGGEGEARRAEKAGEGEKKEGDADLEVIAEFMDDNHDDSIGDEHSSPETKETDDNRGYVLTDMLVVEPETGKNMPVFQPGRQSRALKEDYDKLPDTTTFASSVRRMFQAKLLIDQERELLKGKLDTHSLTKIFTGSKKIFKQPLLKKDIRSTAISVLVDFSGSMMTRGYPRGEVAPHLKLAHALKATVLLNDSIAKLGIPTEIAAFTYAYGGWEDADGDASTGMEFRKSIHIILKRFDNLVNSNHIVKWVTDLAEGGTQDNADGESILFAANRLLARRERRKILIVLSDGEPAARTNGDISKFTRQVTDNIEKRTPVELYGIGINSGAVRRYYTNYSVIDDPAQLEGKLLNIVKEKVL